MHVSFYLFICLKTVTISCRLKGYTIILIKAIKIDADFNSFFFQTVNFISLFQIVSFDC